MSKFRKAANRRRFPVLAVLAAGALLQQAQPAQAQFLELLKNLAPTAAGVARPDPPASTPASNTLSTLNSSSPAAAARKARIASELEPDRQCSRAQEKFNIAEKLMDYGGSEAALRLERLIASDFKYDELTPEDREMLRYLAQTTVWVPVEVELKLGAVFDLGSSLGAGAASDLTPIEEDVLREVQGQLGRFRALTTDFPGEPSLRLNSELSDGAFAKFGARIQISRTMLQTMSQRPAGADLLLAHELAHIYKRHELKRMQFELLSSRDGWELAKKLLQRAQRGASLDPIRDGWFMLTVVPQLVSFVRHLQLSFSAEQELEADACAARWLKDAGRDPMLAWSEFRDGIVASGDSPQGYARSHPPTADREKNYVTRVSKPVAVKDESATPNPAARLGEKLSNATKAKPAPKAGPKPTGS